MLSPRFQILVWMFAMWIHQSAAAQAGSVPTITADQLLTWFDSTSLPRDNEYGATLALEEAASGAWLFSIGAPGVGGVQLYERPPWSNFISSHPGVLLNDPQPMPVAYESFPIHARVDAGSATTSIVRSDTGDVLVASLDGGPVAALVMHRFVPESGAPVSFLAVGQPEFFGGAGRVRFYELGTDGSWVHKATFAGAFPSRLGEALAADGLTVVAGAPGRGDNGSVHIYVRATSWLELQRIDSPASGQSGAAFGVAVALDGDLLAIGSRFLDRLTPPPARLDAGGVYVYEVVTSPFLEFELQALLRPPGVSDGDRFGTSVDLAQRTSGAVELVAGAPGENHSRSNTGAVYRYLRSRQPHASSWHLVSRMVNFEPLDSESLGTTVALGQAGVLAGAPFGLVGDHESTGIVLLFDFRLFADGFESGDLSAWNLVVP